MPHPGLARGQEGLPVHHGHARRSRHGARSRSATATRSSTSTALTDSGSSRATTTVIAVGPAAGAGHRARGEPGGRASRCPTSTATRGRVLARPELPAGDGHLVGGPRSRGGVGAVPSWISGADAPSLDAAAMPPLEVEEDDGRIAVSGDRFSVQFDLSQGTIGVADLRGGRADPLGSDDPTSGALPPTTTAATTCPSGARRGRRPAGAGG